MSLAVGSPPLDGLRIHRAVPMLMTIRFILTKACRTLAVMTNMTSATMRQASSINKNISPPTGLENSQERV